MRRCKSGILRRIRKRRIVDWPDTMVNQQIVLTYLYLLLYVFLSSGVILYNKVPIQ